MEGYEMIDIAMNNAYDALIGDKTIMDIVSDETNELIFVPDPELSDTELGEDLLEYFIGTEEYEKCADIRDIMQLSSILNKLIK
ncbi:MAG: hypothetical protein H8E16_21440 [Flavobacteriales bacterium]|jgi:hypothetical protein|nr:hypothetical protein [Flavobacteriales bacterium]